MDWHLHITMDPGILVGKPVIKGTRLAVEFVIELLANGWTQAQIIENYPSLSDVEIQACLAYAHDILHQERVFPLISA